MSLLLIFVLPKSSALSKIIKVSRSAHLNFMASFQHSLLHKGYDMYMATSREKEKSPTVYVTDPGKRQVIFSAVDEPS